VENPWFSEDPGGLHGCYFRLSDVGRQEQAAAAAGLGGGTKDGIGWLTLTRWRSSAIDYANRARVLIRS